MLSEVILHGHTICICGAQFLHTNLSLQSCFSRGVQCLCLISVEGGVCLRTTASGLKTMEHNDFAELCITMSFQGFFACKRTPCWLVPAGQAEAQIAAGLCLAFLLRWLDGSAAVAQAFLDKNDALTALVGCLTTRWTGSSASCVPSNTI